MKLFANKVAVVTGGASGIGRATVEKLVDGGAKVARFDLTTFSPAHDQIISHTVDVTDRAAIEAATQATVDAWGGINLLVNAAGIGASGTVLDNDDAEWQRMMETNVMGTVRVIKAVVPHLLDHPDSAIVNVGSIVATTGFPNRVPYTASKGALTSLTLAMASDYLKHGLRVNAVSPSAIDTPWVSRLLSQADDPELERQQLVARQLHGRLVKAEEVAGAIAYLIGPHAGSTNGVVLPVDSGVNSVYFDRS